MATLRRTVPIALAVGAAIGVLFASFQSVDAIFANPGMVASFGGLIAFLARAYFLYVLTFCILQIIINLLLCLFIPRRMRDADYARVVEYNTGLAMFIILVFLYTWNDQEAIGEMLRLRQGALAKLFLFAEIFIIGGMAAFIIAGAVHQLIARLPRGRVALYISSVAWFVLLFPLAGEVVLLAIGVKLHPILQILILIVVAFIVSFIVKLLNRWTHALIALKRRAWVGTIALLAVCFALWGIIALMQPKQTYARRSGDEINVVMLSIDALRADHLGCYGYEPANPLIEPGKFSPNIDRFASEALLFENTYSTAPWTLASISSWMTGAWPVESGGTYLNKRVYRAITTLPEALREEGYACGAFHCNPYMNPATGLGRGFGKYWEFFNASHLSTGLLFDEVNFYIHKKLDDLGLWESGRMIVDKQVGNAFDWLDTHKDEKFFLWVHLYDPHYPYTPPSPYKDELPDIGGIRRAPSYGGLPSWRTGSAHYKYGLKRHIVNLYDAELRFSDEVAGRILDRLDELDLKDDTLVIILSDHGEEFFDHNGLEHGSTVYQEVLHVPLIFRLPGRIQPGRISDVVSLIDLFPTLLDFTGASVEPKLYRGESLAEAVLRGDMSYAGDGRMNLNPGSTGDSEEKTISERLEALKSSRSAAARDASGVLMDAAEVQLGVKPKFVPPEGRVIFSEDLFYFDEDLQGIRIGDWKYIHSRNRFHDPSIFDASYQAEDDEEEFLPDFVEGDELFNLADDPHELKNVIYDNPEMARYLRLRLKEIDEADRMVGKMHKEMEGDMSYFGAGLRGLAKSLGYLDQ